jgi:hypothetical protein
VLDVSSMINSKTLATSSVEDCEAYCNITPGCDGYDWCDSASGCGAYCIDHNSRNPAGEQTFWTAVMPRAAVLVVQANTAQGACHWVCRRARHMFRAHNVKLPRRDAKPGRPHQAQPRLGAAPHRPGPLWHH